MTTAGEVAFAAWRKAFPCPGLAQVIAEARRVAASTPWGASPAACDELKRQIESSQSPLERATLSAHLRETERQIFEFRGEAAVRANGVFGSPESLALLLSDLRAMAAAMGQELSRREASDPLRATLAGALSQHFRPAVSLYEAGLAAAIAGKKLPGGLQPECASYLLRGCSWQEVAA